MNLVFFGKIRIVYHHIVRKHCTVTAQYYRNVLKGPLKNKMAEKKPKLAANGWILHQDNAPSHRAKTTQETIAQLGIEIMPHPPFSQDLAPCDFYLFPRVKRILRGRHFQTNTELNSAISGILNRMSNKGFSECLGNGVECWN